MSRKLPGHDWDQQPSVLSACAVVWAAVPLVVLLAATLPARGQTVPRQLNTELNGQGVGSVHQAGLASLGNFPWNLGSLPSENRNAVALSGRLRSEIRGEYLAKGPLAPGGLQAYIPTAPMPYGSTRPYGTSPRQVATLGPAPPARGGVASLPTTYTGLLHGTSASSGGTLRLSAPTAPVPYGSTPTVSGVKPPLVTSNYGVLHGPRPEPVRLEPGLVIPPRVAASAPSP